MREICLDTETTGLDPDKDRIIEIGCVVLDDLIPTGELFNVHINPQCQLSPRITQITGLTDDDLSDKPVFADSEVSQAFIEFIGDCPLVAHNAPFDRGFLNAELERCGMSVLPDDRFIDTLVLARSRFPGAGNSLDALAIRYGLAEENRSVHGAYGDSVLLAGVYLELRGGRARSFDFVSDTASDSVAGVMDQGKIREPQANSCSRLTDADRIAHEAFIASLGESVLWKFKSA